MKTNFFESELFLERKDGLADIKGWSDIHHTAFHVLVKDSLGQEKYDKAIAMAKSIAETNGTRVFENLLYYSFPKGVETFRRLLCDILRHEGILISADTRIFPVVGNITVQTGENSFSCPSVISLAELVEFMQTPVSSNRGRIDLTTLMNKTKWIQTFDWLRTKDVIDVVGGKTTGPVWVMFCKTFIWIENRTVVEIEGEIERITAENPTIDHVILFSTLVEYRQRNLIEHNEMEPKEANKFTRSSGRNNRGPNLLENYEYDFASNEWLKK